MKSNLNRASLSASSPRFFSLLFPSSPRLPFKDFRGEEFDDFKWYLRRFRKFSLRRKTKSSLVYLYCARAMFVSRGKSRLFLHLLYSCGRSSFPSSWSVTRPPGGVARTGGPRDEFIYIYKTRQCSKRVYLLVGRSVEFSDRSANWIVSIKNDAFSANSKFHIASRTIFSVYLLAD